LPTYIALIRAINVGGTGKLPMADLRKLCETAGFTDVRTYIQSGNVVFRASGSAAATKKKLEDALEKRLKKRHTAIVRSLAELEAVEQANPYRTAEGKFVYVLFLDDAPPKATLAGWKTPGGEGLTLRGREIFMHFPKGMGQSKMKIPLADVGTARNLNTVRALIALARDDA
jgi:uncharacterized protein (DUF1697 family)